MDHGLDHGNAHRRADHAAQLAVGQGDAHQQQGHRPQGTAQQLQRFVDHAGNAPAGLRVQQAGNDGQGNRVDHAVLDRLPQGAGQALGPAFAAELPGLGQLEHHGAAAQQHQGVHGDQRQQRDQAFLAVDQADQRDADHHVVAEGVRQGARGGQGVEAEDQHGADKHQADRQEVDQDGAEIQLAQLHARHGAKQQRGREDVEHQVRQVLDRGGPHPVQLGGDEPQNNQQDHRQQGRQRRRIHNQYQSRESGSPTTAPCPSRLAGTAHPACGRCAVRCQGSYALPRGWQRTPGTPARQNAMRSPTLRLRPLSGAACLMAEVWA